MCHVRERIGIHTGFWWGNMKEGDNVEDLDLHASIILKWIPKNRMIGMD
jgi:hypothetical protein